MLTLLVTLPDLQPLPHDVPVVQTQSLALVAQQGSPEPGPVPHTLAWCQPPPPLALQASLALAAQVLEDGGPGLGSRHGQTEVILSDPAPGGVAPLLGVVALQTRARPHTQLSGAPSVTSKVLHNQIPRDPSFALLTW